jgi:succinate dehydrogenase/fumarate reductase flavoprotein subunit
MKASSMKYDAVIVGAGIAGLTAALKAAETCNVAVLRKVYAGLPKRNHGHEAHFGG